MKYLNFEGLQYFYSKLSSSLASQYVSQGNLKTINGQSLIGTGDITIEGGASGDYLPLSGGEMTGYISWENNKSVIDDCELHFNSSLSTGEDRTRLTMESDYLSISYITANDDYTGHIIASVSKNDGPSISVSNDQTDAAIIINNTGIKYKNGGSPTKVFATDGSVVDMNTYLPSSGGELSGPLYMISTNPQLQLIGGTDSLFLKDTENNILVSVETMSDHSPVNEKTYGKIYCSYSDNSSESTLSPGALVLTGNSGGEGEPDTISYSYNNINIYMPDGMYRFNLQKLIDDGYLIK